MTGIFQEWQPRYAEHGVATFPVREKRPAVNGYLRMGLPASQQLALKFANDNAFGLACRPNRITVVDVDTPDERVLADALSEFGPTPFIVRSGSGNWQAWYRNTGEKRRVRPDPDRPIDILGNGFVVAPPSKGAKGRYTLVQGSLEDLKRLPPLRRVVAAQAPLNVAIPKVETGKRNHELFRACLKAARECRQPSDVMRRAVEMNQAMFYEPLPDEEVLRVVASAWSMELSGNNWCGSSGRVVVDAGEVDELLRNHPDAFILLTILRRHHWGNHEFRIANEMAGTMPGGGWPRQRFAAARKHLEDIGEIEMMRPPSSYHGPAIYRFKGVR